MSTEQWLFKWVLLLSCSVKITEPRIPSNHKTQLQIAKQPPDSVIPSREKQLPKRREIRKGSYYIGALKVGRIN
jgi:hypothetical protein